MASNLVKEADSVYGDDDELFGGGVEHGESNVGGIPNFDLLGMESELEIPGMTGELNMKSEDGSETHLEAEKDSLAEHSVERKSLETNTSSDNSFEVTYREKRCHSDVHERRKAFSTSSQGEVFDNEEEYSYSKPVNHSRVREEELSEEENIIRDSMMCKSKSLPDLVMSTCACLHPVTPLRFQSLDHQQHPNAEHAESLMKKHKEKQAIEGQTNVWKTPPQDLDGSRTGARPKSVSGLKRKVSFKEGTNDNEGSGQACEELNKLQSERRRVFSSAGYGTGSDSESRDIETERQLSQLSQGSSGVWTSQESECRVVDVEEENNLAAVIPEFSEMYLSNSQSITDETVLSSGSDFSLSGSKDSSRQSSTHTVIDLTKQPIYREDRQRITDDSNCSSQDLSESVELSRTSYPATSFQRLRLDDGKDTSERLPFAETSQGNLPNFLDESFSLQRSSIEKVQEEERRNILTVQQIYFGMPDEQGMAAPGGSQAGSMPPSGGSLGTTQMSPQMQLQMLEELLMKCPEDGSPKTLEEILHLIRGPYSHSPFTPNREQERAVEGAKNFTNISREELERASRCRARGCKEQCCLKLQEIHRLLKIDGATVGGLLKSYCVSLWQHCNDLACDMRCPVQFCPDFSNWELHGASQDKILLKMIHKIQSYHRNPTMEILYNGNPKFRKLQSSIPRHDVVAFETYLPMFPLGRFGSALVCMEKETQQLVVVKTYLLMDFKHQLSLYSLIHDVCHPNIVRQLWVLEYEEKIQVCTVFAQGGSLEDYLNKAGKLPWQLAVAYMKQIVSALLFLQDRGVIYLYWSSGNMLFADARCRNIQVNNFSLACPKSHQFDIEAVKECLPCHLCPPELLKEHRIDFKSDSWGAGCLFYEMLTGTPVFERFRHEERSVVYRKILDVNQPDISRMSRELKNALDCCLKVNLADRWDLRQLQQYLQSLVTR